MTAVGRDARHLPGTGGTPPLPRERDRWIDLLRALALVQVVTVHTFDRPWLSLVFPAMGVLAALGGSLAASSLDRVTTPRTFYAQRIRRLLPPLWVFGAVVVPVMLHLGWQVDPDQGADRLTWSTGWLWIFPISDPPGSTAGMAWVTPLRYIRTYLWLVLLSPALLWLFRRWPLRIAAVPVVLMGLLVTGLLNLNGSRTYDILVELAVFTCCWLAGFAHHDGTLQRLPWRRAAPAGVALLGAGVWFALSHRAVHGSYNPDDIPLAAMLCSLGAVLLLLRLSPALTWWRRLPTLGAVAGLLNGRALTIYLWANVATALAPPVLSRTPLGRYDVPGLQGQLLEYAAAWVLILVAILLWGWVEDLAAARRPRLLPWGRLARAGSRTVVLEGDVADRGDAVPRIPAQDRTAGRTPSVADVVFRGNAAVEQEDRDAIPGSRPPAAPAQRDGGPGPARPVR